MDFYEIINLGKIIIHWIGFLIILVFFLWLLVASFCLGMFSHYTHPTPTILGKIINIIIYIAIGCLIVKFGYYILEKYYVYFNL